MDQYNTLKVTFSVKKLENEGEETGNFKLSSKDNKPAPNAANTKRSSAPRSSDVKKTGILKKNSNKSLHQSNSNSSMKPAVSIAATPSSKKQKALAKSPPAVRPSSAQIPSYKSSHETSTGLHLRSKQPPLPTSSRRSTYMGNKDWNFSTSGIRRDLLQIAQDESISLYNTLKSPPKPIPRPASAVNHSTHRHGDPVIVRERKPKPINLFDSDLHDPSNIAGRWSAQTHDDESEDRAKPERKNSYRSREEFLKLMSTMNTSKCTARLRR